MEICTAHNKAYTHICTHPDCFKFQPLCSTCLNVHQNQHPKNQLVEDRNFIISREEATTLTLDTLNKLKEDLDQIMNKAVNALINPVNSNIDEVILEIESIRQQIMKLFDRYIQQLKDKFEQKIKMNIFQTHSQIKEYLAQVDILIEQHDQLEIQKKILSTDLQYQVLYQKSRLENLIYQRANQKFSGSIDDDIALHFIGVIQKELDQLVIYDNLNFENSQQPITNSEKPLKRFEKFKTFIDRQVSTTLLNDDQFYHNNWMFYFEPGTKNFHYLDVSAKQPKLQTIQLKNDFQISNGSRSTFGADGKIYYFHGYDDGKNEDFYKTIYQLNFRECMLIPKAKMHTVRKNFSLNSTSSKEIYIIGGQNYMEGCLIKCEKFIIDTQTITIINHLLEESALHTTCLYNNQYIFKFGGLRAFIENENIRSICQSQLQIYNIDQDQWECVEFKSQAPSPIPTILSASIQIPYQNEIYVFGGQVLLNKALQNTNQGFKLKIEEYEEFDLTDQIKSSLSFVYELHQATLHPGYPVCDPILYNDQLHVLLKDKKIDHYVRYQKQWKKIE